MKTVETMVGNIAKPDPGAERQRQKEDDLAEKLEKSDAAMTAKAVSEAHGNGRDDRLNSLSDLFQSGAQFLMGLGELMTKPGESAEKRLQTLISRDQTTGAAYLKIPLPETKTIKIFFEALGELLSQATHPEGNRK